MGADTRALQKQIEAEIEEAKVRAQREWDEDIANGIVRMTSKKMRIAELALTNPDDLLSSEKLAIFISETVPVTTIALKSLHEVGLLEIVQEDPNPDKTTYKVVNRAELNKQLAINANRRMDKLSELYAKKGRVLSPEDHDPELRRMASIQI